MEFLINLISVENVSYFMCLCDWYVSPFFLIFIKKMVQIGFHELVTYLLERILKRKNIKIFIDEKKENTSIEAFKQQIEFCR